MELSGFLLNLPAICKMVRKAAPFGFTEGGILQGSEAEQLSAFHPCGYQKTFVRVFNRHFELH